MKDIRIRTKETVLVILSDHLFKEGQTPIHNRTLETLFLSIMCEDNVVSLVWNVLISYKFYIVSEPKNARVIFVEKPRMKIISV